MQHPRYLRSAVEAVLAKSMVEVNRTRLGRASTHKAQMLIAVEESGADIGQVRIRHLRQVGSTEAFPFAREHIEAGTVVITPPWFGYAPLREAGFQHHSAEQSATGHTLPSVEQVTAILRLWLWSRARPTFRARRCKATSTSSPSASTAAATHRGCCSTG